jgi:hypothetical protein
MSNDGLSEKSKTGGILNVFRRIQTRLPGFFRKGTKPIFLKDELLGEFSGNILESIAKLYPLDAASKIEKAPPILATWKVIERITLEGERTFLYYVSPGTSIQVLGVISSIYEEKHQIIGSPGIFDGRKDNLPSFLLNAYDYIYKGKHEIKIIEEFFMIWLPEEVQVNASST